MKPYRALAVKQPITGVDTALYRSFLAKVYGNSNTKIFEGIKQVSDPIVNKLKDFNIINIPQYNIGDQLWSVKGPNLTVTGGGNGSRFDENGLLITELPADRPRYNFNPETGIYEGVNLEVEDTNFALRSVEFESSYWNLSQSNAFRELSDLASPEGLLNAYRAEKTGVSLDAIFRGNLASTGMYKSVFIRSVIGSGSIHTLKFNGVSEGLFNVNEIWSRKSLQFNLSETGGGNLYVIDLRNEEATLTEAIVYGAQASNFNTSFIKTFGTEVTRSADTYTSLGAITGTSYTIYRELNGDKIADYHHDGNRNRYINGVFDSTIAEAPIADLILYSTGSDKLLAVAVKEGEITEPELIEMTST